MIFSEWLGNQIQKNLVFNKLKEKLPEFQDDQINNLIDRFKLIEEKYASEKDKKQSLTIFRFLNTIKYDKNSTAFHNIDIISGNLIKEYEKQIGKNPIESIKLTLRNNKVDEKDIDYLADLVFINKQPIGKVISDYFAKKNKKGNKVLLRDGVFELVEITQWDDGKKEKHMDREYDVVKTHKLFENTSWCVRFVEYFNDYVSSGPLYLIQKNGKPFALGHKDSDILNKNDEELTESEVKEITPIIIKSGIFILITEICKVSFQEVIKQVDQKTLKALLEKLTGFDDPRISGSDIVFASFNNLNELFNFINKMFSVDIYKLQINYIQNLANQDYDYELNDENRSTLNKLLSKKTGSYYIKDNLISIYENNIKIYYGGDFKRTMQKAFSLPVGDSHFDFEIEFVFSENNSFFYIDINSFSKFLKLFYKENTCFYDLFNFSNKEIDNIENTIKFEHKFNSKKYNKQVSEFFKEEFFLN